MALDFKATTKPVVASTREPNPYVPVLAALIETRAGDDTAALSATVPGDSKSPAVNKEVRLLQLAARELDVSAHIRREDGKVSGKPVTKLTVWTTARITRPRSTDKPELPSK